MHSRAGASSYKVAGEASSSAVVDSSRSSCRPLASRAPGRSDLACNRCVPDFQAPIAALFDGNQHWGNEQCTRWHLSIVATRPRVTRASVTAYEVRGPLFPAAMGITQRRACALCLSYRWPLRLPARVRPTRKRSAAGKRISVCTLVPGVWSTSNGRCEAVRSPFYPRLPSPRLVGLGRPNE